MRDFLKAEIWIGGKVHESLVEALCRALPAAIPLEPFEILSEPVVEVVHG